MCASEPVSLSRNKSAFIFVFVKRYASFAINPLINLAL
jgi:hypothetical protein